jgi:hypothetical protein
MTSKNALRVGMVACLLIVFAGGWVCLILNSPKPYDWIQEGMDISEVTGRLRAEGDYNNIGLSRGKNGGFVWHIHVTRGTIVASCDQENRVNTWRFEPYRERLSVLDSIRRWMK